MAATARYLRGFNLQVRQESGGGGQKFITVDASGNAAASVMSFDTYNFRKASNVHIAGHGNFTRQREDEFDLRSGS